MNAKAKAILSTAAVVVGVLVALKLIKGANVPVLSSAVRSYT